jgi:hypothetical protein
MRNPGRVARRSGAACPSRVLLIGAVAALAAPAALAGLTGASASAPSPTGSAAAAVACTVLPADNIWNHRVDRLPVPSSSAALVRSIGPTGHLHPDFGSGLIDGAPFGFPITTVPAGQALVPVGFDIPQESDPGPYPIPANARIEGGAGSTGDRHVLVYQPSSCRLYELFAAHRLANGSWHAGSGAVFNLRSDRLRPRNWTSADAAGLPILPGLVRYDEVAAGAIRHAIRVTVSRSRNTFLWPARHQASSLTGASLPPMGLRLRMKASVSLAGLPPQSRVIAQAMKTYGLIVADNGSSWFFSGTQDSRWNNDDLNALKAFTGADFEVVDESGLMISPDSGAAKP